MEQYMLCVFDDGRFIGAIDYHRGIVHIGADKVPVLPQDKAYAAQDEFARHINADRKVRAWPINEASKLKVGARPDNASSSHCTD